MTAADLIPILPSLIIAGTSLAVLLLLAIHRSRLGTVVLSVAGLAIAAGAAVWIADPTPRQVTALLVIDNFGLFFVALICLAGIAVALLGSDYWPAGTLLSEEFYLLMLLAVLGSTVLVSSVHFASFFLGLEILSVSLYSMIAYERTEPERTEPERTEPERTEPERTEPERTEPERTEPAAVEDSGADLEFVERGGPVGLGIEAGIKYLVLAAVSAAFLLFGMALVYFESGSLSFSGLADARGAASPTVMIGVGMILVGVGFKLALIPLHLWTPDVYQGAPVPTTAFVASVSKGAMFALLLRFFSVSGVLQNPHVNELIVMVAIASMFIGNLLALEQKNIKRILAYSSIAHMGYLLVALVSVGANGAAAAAFYFVFYFISIIGAFAVVAIVSRPSGDLAGRGELDAKYEIGDLAEYAGLAWHRPWLAVAMSAMLFSLAGIPLTVGFIGKFYVLTSGVRAGQWGLVIALVLSSVIALYYYLRVIVTLFGDEKPKWSRGQEPRRLTGHRAALGSSSATLVVLCLLLIGLGLYPAPVIEWVQQIAATL